MEERSELKTPKTYSLDPAVIAWVTQRAAVLTIKNESRISESQVVNDILRAAMEKDAEDSLSPTESKRKTNPKMRAVSIAA
jgi:hypothetical protein